MKVGVSRILPSISNWLSPKVDVTNARRRRHEEIDSDDDAGAVRGNFPATTATDIRYQTTPQMSAPPPNKKKKTFSVSFPYILSIHFPNKKEKLITQ